jgi:hypothetical protein
MKLTWTAALPVAASLFFFPSITRAQNGQIASETPGVVELTQKVDAQKLAPGATIETRLTHAVHFANGMAFPAGTRLIATVAQDDMQTEGKMKLALRFTSAQMKDGKTVPIRATILNVATQAVAVENDPSTIEPIMQVRDNLNGQPDRVDAVGIASGIDLHSNASSQNSGVFVTTTKDDVKLPNGTKMELALAPGL